MMPCLTYPAESEAATKPQRLIFYNFRRREDTAAVVDGIAPRMPFAGSMAAVRRQGWIQTGSLGELDFLPKYSGSTVALVAYIQTF